MKKLTELSPYWRALILFVILTAAFTLIDWFRGDTTPISATLIRSLCDSVACLIVMLVIDASKKRKLARGSNSPAQPKWSYALAFSIFVAFIIMTDHIVKQLLLGGQLNAVHEIVAALICLVIAFVVGYLIPRPQACESTNAHR